VLYSIVLLIVPLIWILQKLWNANIPKDYHELSTAVKLVMVAGLLSMIFFKIYS
jgi:hypothetical protein